MVGTGSGWVPVQYIISGQFKWVWFPFQVGVVPSSSGCGSQFKWVCFPVQVGVLPSSSGCGFSGSQFKDEDDLTRKLQLEKEYQVFVKMDKRVPGTK